MPGDELLDQLLANRDDDELMVVYADQLAATDPLRAELIVLQCSIERGGMPRDRAVAARRRAAEIVAGHGARFANLIGLATRWQFSRGFVVSAQIAATTFLERSDELIARAPLLHRLAISELRADPIPDDDLDGIHQARDIMALIELVLETAQRHPIPMLDLGEIRTIAYCGDSSSANLAEQVVDRMVAMGTLRKLRGLAMRDVPASALHLLARSEDAGGLDDLELELTDDHRHELVPADTTLRPSRLSLRLPQAHRRWAEHATLLTSGVTDLGHVYSAELPAAMRPRLRSLALRTQLAAGSLDAIAYDPAYRGLQALTVETVSDQSSRDPDCSPALAPLLRADGLQLRVLRLAMRVDEAVVRAVLASPLARTLEVLDLREAKGARELDLPGDGELVILR